jgi:hypothetical protein
MRSDPPLATRLDQLAGRITLIAADRLECLDAVDTEALEDLADGCPRDADLGGDLLAGEALPAKLRP